MSFSGRYYRQQKRWAISLLISITKYLLLYYVFLSKGLVVHGKGIDDHRKFIGNKEPCRTDVQMVEN